MKKILFCLLGLAILFSLLTGCGGGAPAPITEGGADKLLEYISGSSNEDYKLTENAELDLTGKLMSHDRTVLLKEGTTLKLTGTITPAEGCITFRAESESAKNPILDLSGLSLEDVELKEATLFEVRSDITLVYPVESEALVVELGDEWTSIKSVIPQVDEPQDNEPQKPGPKNDDGVSTPKEFLQAFGDPAVEKIELSNDITVNLDSVSLSRDLFIICNSNKLSLSGKLHMDGGVLDIGEKPGVESGTVDLSGLTVICGSNDYTRDLIFIGLNFKHIIGEPTLGEGILYEIPDSGECASVKLKEVITPEMHEAKLQEEMTQYLSGVEFSGGVGMSAEFLADGVLEINLDNPVIDHEIGVGIDGGLTLILTGSVTFDGGLYGFELHNDSSGTATVDITGLEIHGTKALGDTKSPDIFKITGDGINFIYNKNAPHIKVVQNDQFWLRYEQ